METQLILGLIFGLPIAAMSTAALHDYFRKKELYGFSDRELLKELKRREIEAQIRKEAVKKLEDAYPALTGE